ncbi:hypothetical protein C8F01DRAFT_792533 [Mycena amicta]|nr:hypothetical protein C8F01DRAFT_792533 [Mycena amicta]
MASLRTGIPKRHLPPRRRVLPCVQIVQLVGNNNAATVAAIFNVFDEGGVDERIVRAPSVSLPWRNLRTLAFPFAMCPVDVWCAALAECPLIENCMVTVSPPAGRLPGSAIRLGYLESLRLTTHNGAGDVFLSSLVAPRLKHCGLQGNIAMTALLNFQKRSEFNLECLAMLLRLPTNDICPLLHGLPTLQSLALMVASTEHFPDDVWTRIALGELLPSLRSLILTPRVAQMPSLPGGGYRDELGIMQDGQGVKDRITLEVVFVDVSPNDVSALKEGLGPAGEVQCIG